MGAWRVPVRASGALLLESKAVPAVPSAVTAAAAVFSRRRNAGGTRLVAGTVDGRILEVALDPVLRVVGETQLRGGPVFSLASTDAAGQGEAPSLFAGTAQRGVVDLSDGARRMEDLRGHTGWVRSLLALPEGRLLSVGCQWLRVWDATSGANCGVDAPQSRGDVLATALDPGGGHVLTASTDGTVRRWALGEAGFALSAEACLPLPARLDPRVRIKAASRRGGVGLADLTELVRVTAVAATCHAVYAGDNKGQLFTLHPTSLVSCFPCTQLPGPITSIAVDGDSLVVGGQFGVALFSSSPASAGEMQPASYAPDTPPCRCVAGVGNMRFAAGMQDGSIRLYQT